MRKILYAAGVGLLNALVTITCGVAESVTDRFLLIPPSPWHPLFQALLTVFEFPLLTLYRLHDPQKLYHYLPVLIANSVLWATLFFAALVMWSSRCREEPA